jgi:hypothetical protein
MLNYKDFPKSDARRYFIVLFALERLKDRATIHYIAQAVNCTRSEAQRAIEIAQLQFGVEIEKDGSVYKIASWGALKRNAALLLITENAA